MKEINIHRYLSWQLDATRTIIYKRYKSGLIQVKECKGKSKAKIIWINIKLFVFWIFRIYKLEV